MFGAMWPFGKASVELWQRLTELEARTAACELQLAGDRLEILETIDRLSYRGAQRDRARARVSDSQPPPPEETTDEFRALGARFRFGKE